MNRRRAMYGEMIQASGQVAEFLFAVATRDFEKLNEEALDAWVAVQETVGLFVDRRSLALGYLGRQRFPIGCADARRLAHNCCFQSSSRLLPGRLLITRFTGLSKTKRGARSSLGRRTCSATSLSCGTRNTSSSNLRLWTTAQTLPLLYLLQSERLSIMRSVNKVTLLGHVGQKPNIILSSGGNLIANLSLATSYTLPAKDGHEAQQVTEWHRLVCFKRLAEVVRDYVTKGAALYVEGQLQTRSWDKDGEKRYSTEIVVRELSMLGGKPGTGAATAPLSGIAVEEAAARVNAEISDDDIPF